MTTYTISDHGEITNGLSAVDAADILLTDDGHEYEMRQDADGGYTLYISPHSRNSTIGGRPMVRSVIYTLETDEELAARDIAAAVIRSGRWEKGELSCMTDEAHAAMMAELAAEQEGWKMTNRNYKTLKDLDVSLADITRWADARETDVVVAVAIHAIADLRRSPEAIWEDPTPTEADHVTIAVEEYVMHGDYDQSDDGRYCWGQTYITLGEAQA